MSKPVKLTSKNKEALRETIREMSSRLQHQAQDSVMHHRLYDRIKDLEACEAALSSLPVYAPPKETQPWLPGMGPPTTPWLPGLAPEGTAS